MSEQNGLGVGRNIKIGFFHLGSGISDVMITGVWNRIMISDLGFAATPISLLASLRYFLAPLAIWSGRLSDSHAFGGYPRLFWIWLGRGLMVISTFILGMTTATLARGAEATAQIWGGLIFAMLLFSFGTAISGSTFLALIYDRSTEQQRGRAVGIVWTFLLLGFTVGGILFGILLPSPPFTGITDYFSPANIANVIEFDSYGGLSFAPGTLETLFIVAGVVLGSLWFFSLLGEEKRVRGDMVRDNGSAAAEMPTSLRADLSLVWRNRAMRFFIIYLALSMLFAFSQDLILEPFAGDVFGMEARITSRFSAYWGSMSILGTILFLFLSRKYKWLTNSVMSYMGVAVLTVTFVLFAYSALAGIRGLVTPGLILLGIGLGIWNVGTLGLMMDMSPLGRAGTFLGFWTLVVTLGRGTGVSSGGILRDLGLQLSGSEPVAYAAVFVIGAVGLTVSYWALTQARVEAYKDAQVAQPVSVDKVFAGAMD